MDIEQSLKSVIASNKDKFVDTGELNVTSMAEDCLSEIVVLRQKIESIKKWAETSKIVEDFGYQQAVESVLNLLEGETQWI